MYYNVVELAYKACEQCSGQKASVLQGRWNSEFQGYRFGIIQLKDQDAPFVLGVHCMAHHTNLAEEPLSNLHVVSKLEILCHALYSYFSMSSKKHLKSHKLVDIVETKGLQILRNVKTR